MLAPVRIRKFTSYIIGISLIFLNMDNVDLTRLAGHCRMASPSRWMRLPWCKYDRRGHLDEQS